MITSIDPVTSSQAKTAQPSTSTSADAGGFAAVLGQAVSANLKALQASAQASGTGASAALQSNLTPVGASQTQEDGKQHDAFVLGSLGFQASLAASHGNAGAFTILAFMMNNQMLEMGLGGGQAKTTQTASASPSATAAPARNTKRPLASSAASSATKKASAAQAAASSASTTSSASASLTDTILSNAATSGTAAASNAGTSSSAVLASNANSASSSSAASNAGTSPSASAAASGANAAASASEAPDGGQDSSFESSLDTLAGELETLLSELDGADRAQALKILRDLAASYDSVA